MAGKSDYTEAEVKKALAWSLLNSVTPPNKTTAMSIQMLVAAIDTEGVALLLKSGWFTPESIHERVAAWRKRT